LRGESAVLPATLIAWKLAPDVLQDLVKKGFKFKTLM
jgi:hypothetical protein